LVKSAYVKKLRLAVQWSILAIVVYGGWRLYAFVRHFEAGGPYVSRAPLVEGFLPIGALMSLKIWLTRGVFDKVHPAGLVIFLGAVIISLLFKKSFCGWICPVGTVSELIYKIGRRVFGRNFALPRWADYPLRSLKYVLMGFFLFIVIKMPREGLENFLGGAYWKVADIKMLLFFKEMSTLVVLAGLFIGSLLYKNFWCRYLCPYGALLGLLSLMSPVKIVRKESACNHCRRCTRACPALLPVEEKQVIRSPECMGCLSCVAACPAKGALSARGLGKGVNPLIYAVLVIVLFFGLLWGAKLGAHWHSSVSYADYRDLIPVARALNHP
jgi:polyferredoxin